VRRAFAAAPFALLLGALSASCGPEVRPANPLVDPGGACDELATGDFTRLEATPRVHAFLDAAARLDKTSRELEEKLFAICTDVGKAIGMADVDLKAPIGGGHGAETVCSNVAAKIGAVLKANPEAQLAVVIQEPRCRVEVDAAKSCIESCAVTKVNASDIAASCQGGDVAGRCNGQCKGACAMPAGKCAGVCRGECSGKCDAKFAGTCGGRCDGTCDGKPAKGACKGRCEGKCSGKAKGTCGGGCDGSCDASCEIKAGSSCAGLCAGGCSVPLDHATCTGDLRPPGADNVCAAACAARGVLEASCEAPGVRITVKGKPNAATQKLVAALGASLPKLVAIQYGSGQRLLAAASALGATNNEVKDAALRRGQHAGGCAVAAGNAANAAAATLRIEVSACATVSAAAGAITSGARKGG
jgi:hypothetical protein